MSEQNFENRTFCHGENLDFLRGLNSETIDLIATDPPFQKGPDFGTTPDSIDSKSKFKNRWIWNIHDLDGTDVREAWIDQIVDNQPNVNKIIEAARVGWGNDAAAYLCYMSIRLLEMHRVLKKSGSMYLHCNSEISHYLKLVMDVIFGNRNFRNEIVWDYGLDRFSKKPSRNLNISYDTILFYVKGSSYPFEFPDQYVNLSRSKRGRFERFPDRDGLDISGDVWNLFSSRKTLQRPLAIYKRMIETSTKPGDVVLDPFSGYGTTLVASELLDRQWIGMDLWEKSGNILLERLRSGANDFSETDIIYLSKTLGRTDLLDDSPLIYLEYKRKLELWEELNRAQIRKILEETQKDGEKVVCAGCGRCLEKPFMTLDHVNPKSAGGRDSIENRILLCQPCNGNKKNIYTLSGLWIRNQADGWMVDLDKAHEVHQKVLEKIEEVKDNRF